MAVAAVNGTSLEFYIDGRVFHYSTSYLNLSRSRHSNYQMYPTKNVHVKPKS